MHICSKKNAPMKNFTGLYVRSYFINFQIGKESWIDEDCMDCGEAKQREIKLKTKVPMYRNLFSYILMLRIR